MCTCELQLDPGSTSVMYVPWICRGGQWRAFCPTCAPRAIEDNDCFAELIVEPTATSSPVTMVENEPFDIPLDPPSTPSSPLRTNFRTFVFPRGTLTDDQERDGWKSAVLLSTHLVPCSGSVSAMHQDRMIAGLIPRLVCHADCFEIPCVSNRDYETTHSRAAWEAPAPQAMAPGGIVTCIGFKQESALASFRVFFVQLQPIDGGGAPPTAEVTILDAAEEHAAAPAIGRARCLTIVHPGDAWTGPRLWMSEVVFSSPVEGSTAAPSAPITGRQVVLRIDWPPTGSEASRHLSHPTWLVWRMNGVARPSFASDMAVTGGPERAEFSRTRDASWQHCTTLSHIVCVGLEHPCHPLEFSSIHPAVAPAAAATNDRATLAAPPVALARLTKALSDSRLKATARCRIGGGFVSYAAAAGLGSQQRGFCPIAFGMLSAADSLMFHPVRRIRVWFEFPGQAVQFVGDYPLPQTLRDDFSGPPHEEPTTTHDARLPTPAAARRRGTRWPALFNDTAAGDAWVADAKRPATIVLFGHGGEGCVAVLLQPSLSVTNKPATSPGIREMADAEQTALHWIQHNIFVRVKEPSSPASSSSSCRPEWRCRVPLGHFITAGSIHHGPSA